MMEYVFVDDLHRYKRLKVTRACESCRRRKVKCDGGSGGTQTPCSSCRKLKIECIFSNMALKRAPPKSEAEQMDERLQRVENLLHKLDEDDVNNGKRDALGYMKIDYTGRANYIYAEEGKLLKESKPEMGEMLILTEPPLPFTHYPSNVGPTPELAAHLVQLYFKHVHPYIPILHKADFLRRLNDKSNPISPLLLYAVFATAARFSDDPAVRLDMSKPETAGYPYYNRAKDLLDDFLDTPRLSTVQAQILILKFQEGIHRPGFFFRSWLYFGMIIRMAQDLGLNKNFSKWNLQISREDLTARKRVWQICFLCDQFMSGAQGRDIAISLSNTDIDLPLKEDYEDEEEFQIQTDFVHLVRLTKILASVMSVISPAGSGSTLQSWSSNPKLTTLDAALDAWNLALPPRLHCVPAFEANGSLSRPPTSHFAGFLNILYHTVLILLHRPYITSLDTSKVSSPNHVNICTVAANSISQIAQSMFETWGPLVFQYPVRGGNYGVYCLVAASMIHLVNMTSPDLRYSRPAHDHLMRTLRILRVCVEHSAAWELRDRVQALEAAFSAQQARQSVVIFQPGSNPPTPTPSMQGSPYSKARRPQNKRRFATQNNTVGTNLPGDNGQHMLSNSFPNTFSNMQHPVATAPQFQDRPLYLLSEDLSCEPQSFLDPSNPDHTTTMANPFEYINNGSMDDTSMLGSSLQMDLNGSVDQSSYWDNNNLLVWNQLSNPQAHVWTGNGGISPVSLSTSPSAPPSTGQQTPNHSGSSPSLEQVNFVSGNNNTATGAISPSSSPASPPPQITPGVIDPVIVASQNHGELMLYSDYP